MTFELPSSKWWASAVALVAVAGTAFVDAAGIAGIDLPPWVFPVVAVVGAVAVYVKPENRPSSSARDALRYVEWRDR